MRMDGKRGALAAILCLFLFGGCAKGAEVPAVSEKSAAVGGVTQQTPPSARSGGTEAPAEEALPNGTAEPSMAGGTEAPVEEALPDETAELPIAGESAAPVEHSASAGQEAAEAAVAPAAGAGRLVVIDAGHQARANTEQEPIGPGASETKMKVTGGTSGRTTGFAEYQLNLDVALKLEQELLARGYRVIQCRTGNDVDMSNAERAAIANDNQADAFLRIHANGSENTAAHGMMTICQTAENPYNAALYAQSRRLSDCVLDAMTAATGAKREYVWETDTMSGINWAQVPVTIVEMGYMTNPEEDALMATGDYQDRIARGMADGLDAFFAVEK